MLTPCCPCGSIVHMTTTIEKLVEAFESKKLDEEKWISATDINDFLDVCILWAKTCPHDDDRDISDYMQKKIFDFPREHAVSAQELQAISEAMFIVYRVCGHGF